MNWKNKLPHRTRNGRGVSWMGRSRSRTFDQRWPERHPVVLGLAISGILLLGLVAQEILLDRFTLMRADPDVAKVFRIAISHCFMAGYFPAAYYALLRGTRETIRELGETLDPTDADWRVDSAVRITRRTLLILSLIHI